MKWIHTIFANNRSKSLDKKASKEVADKLKNEFYMKMIDEQAEQELLRLKKRDAYLGMGLPKSAPWADDGWLLYGPMGSCYARRVSLDENGELKSKVVRITPDYPSGLNPLLHSLDERSKQMRKLLEMVASVEKNKPSQGSHTE